MLMPITRMREILKRNGLEKGWAPETGKKLLGVVAAKSSDVSAQLDAVEAVYASRTGDPIPDMQKLQDDLVSIIVATLLVASQAGLDASLLFVTGTSAEATGEDNTTTYAGIARAALMNAWGPSYAEMLGLPTPRKD